MRFSILTLLLLCCCSVAHASDGEKFSRFFDNATMRVDYYHTGTKGVETFSLDRIVKEGEWPATRKNLVDHLNLGEFQIRVYDMATNELIFSRGFSSVFNEWQTTDEALAGTYRTFSETVRFPYPKANVQLTMARRDKHLIFRELFSIVIDPNDPTQVDKSVRTTPFASTPLIENGPSENKVDIVILGDGYSRKDMEKFRRDARHFNDIMFSTEPFKSRKSDFNIRIIEVESEESGIDIPDKNIWKRNTLGTRYNTFGSARYVLTNENRTLRDIAGTVPYDAICILINDTRYGGGGIYNQYATTYTAEAVKGQEWQMDYMYVHEFGHSFAGLADEYYGSSTGYNEFYPEGVEPWERNITALHDAANIKWKALVSEGISIPTRWEKSRYDSLEVERGKLDRLAADYYVKREPIFRMQREIRADKRFAGKVGAFEGAGYVSKGLYRPSVDCRMFSLSLVDFDPVCTRTLSEVIDFLTK